MYHPKTFTPDNAPIHFICEVSETKTLKDLKLKPGDRFYTKLWKGEFENNYYHFEVLKHDSVSYDAAWIDESGRRFRSKNDHGCIFSRIKHKTFAVVDQDEVMFEIKEGKNIKDLASPDPSPKKPSVKRPTKRLARKASPTAPRKKPRVKTEPVVRKEKRARKMTQKMVAFINKE